MAEMYSRDKDGNLTPIYNVGLVDVEASKECEAMLDGIIDRSITEVRNDRTKSIGDYAFYRYSLLTTADFPVATSIGSYAFYSCSALTTVDFPVATSIGGYAFYSCSALATLDFPVATSIGSYAFYSCSALTTADFPVATSIESYAFQSCSKLTTVDFPVATSIGSYAFRNCSRLATLRLPGSILCNATGDPKINSTCKIYVPASLIDQYKSATNWSQYASQFVAIEGV